MKQFLPVTQRWFFASVGQPTPAQAEGWPAIASGRDALIAAPTGSGKTLAAFLYFLDGFRRKMDEGALRDELSLLYISPLKALGNDIRENLNRPLAGLGLEGSVRVGVRTGDTPESERRAMRKTPPHILITTPESLFLLLSSVSGREMLRTVKAVIVDEIHAVLSSKRGTHLFLSLARLDALTGRHVQRVGLSATVNPLSAAALHLSGGGGCAVIAPPGEKKTEILVDSPLPDMRDLPERSIWPALGQRVIETLSHARTVLVFADGRATCERLAQQINAQAGEILARTHHGCVSKEQRLEAERMLKSGELRVMIATSSMELGIDVGEIDEVIQIGCPGSVSALIQRLGRAGHRPGCVSRMRIFPRTATEGLFCALTAAAAREGRIERAEPPEMCLDVLSQHLVSMAVADEWTVAAAAALLRAAYPYRRLSEDAVRRVLSMLSGDDERANDRPARPRLIYDRIHDRFTGDEYTRMLALSAGGTIPDRGWFAVTLPDGTRLGELDEEYVFEARLGDKFLLGAFAWRITDILHDRVIVAPDTPAGAASPFWKGDRLMRAYETGKFFGACLETLDRAARRGETSLLTALMALGMTENAARNTARVVCAQLEAVGALATDRTLVVEHFSDETGQAQLMIHSPFGGRVNRALTLLIAAALGADARVYDDDDGALVMLLGESEIPRGLIESLDPTTAAEKVCALLPASPMFSMAFRYNAARALLMGVRGGQRQPLWVQRLRGAETLKAALASKDHPMIAETLQECSGNLLDLAALTDLITAVRAGRVKVLEVYTETPSPLSLALRRQVEADLMYVNPIPAAATASAPAEITLAPDPAVLPESYARAFDAASAERVHELLLTVGDALTEEISAPLEFLEELEAEERALYIDPGLWIAAESIDTYQKALAEGDSDAFRLIVRRLARYGGTQSAESVAERYAVPTARAKDALDRLAAEGALVKYEDEFIHADNYRAAQRKTVALRRSAVRTAPGHAFAALLASRLRTPGSPAQQTAAALAALAGEPHPCEAWENYLLPARVSAYRPALLDAALAHGEAVYRIIAPAEERAAVAQAKKTGGALAHREAACRSIAPARGKDVAAPDEKTGVPLAHCEAACRVTMPAGEKDAVAQAQKTDGTPAHREAACRVTVPAGEKGAAAQAQTTDGAPDYRKAACRVTVPAGEKGTVAQAQKTDGAPTHREAAYHVIVPAGEKGATAHDGKTIGALTVETDIAARSRQINDGFVRELTPREKARSAPKTAKGAAPRMMVCFVLPEDEADEVLSVPDGLDEAEAAVYRALIARGASFARSLASHADERGISAVLQALLRRGLVRADSFSPVRQAAKPVASTLKASLRNRVQALDAGRWEAVRALRPLSAEETLNRLFERRLIACRETAGGDWAQLLPLLRRMEYAGQVRRGYFVEGLSGAQFVREGDFSRVTLALSAPGEDCVCICAADPLQVWGLYFKHLPGREFTRIPSTAVVLRGGKPVCVWERQGGEIRVFDEESLPSAVLTFRDAFLQGAIFPAANRITVKRYPASAAPALESAGFRREMLDYVLTRR